MEISKIKKINVQDGDIICLTDISKSSVFSLNKQLNKAFPDKNFMIIYGTERQIEGIKVLHLEKK